MENHKLGEAICQDRTSSKPAIIHGVLACARLFNVLPWVTPTIAASLGSTMPALSGVSTVP
jgi:hypothetical protein